ncbi:glutathione peroxidase [Nitrosomonas sp. JL21]|nr:glutathione peroxidase [Nitrosomonas sp. JL21]MBL8496399.1 glutathione peroxidase [Nitrosomonas sp.]MCC7090363.1 glutathione peroxidase [Nitrosomonas sp.]MXS77329.1 glutathione peroxidase [Nitrosomonas sp. JL21]
MRILLIMIIALLATPVFACNSSLLDQNFRKLAAEEMVNLCQAYAGKVVLVVNTASKCGYTPQYEGLEQLFEKYQSQGLVVLGFPSNDFMGQEPGTEAEIQDFCRLTYDVKFPMFEKTPVKKEHAHPFYAQLAELSGTFPTWNFQKYLIGRDGKYITFFTPHTKPSDPMVITAIEKALQQ